MDDYQLDEDGAVILPEDTAPPADMRGRRMRMVRTSDGAIIGFRYLMPGELFGGLDFRLEPAEEGDEAVQENPTTPVPMEVTNFQARTIMRRTFLPDGRSIFEALRTELLGHYTRVQNLPANDPERIAAEDDWEAFEMASVVERGGRMVAEAQARFGLGDAQMDAMFRAAEQVRA